ncbi:hypothetical protein GALMADRAFT_66375 [Galerina marginata CBS 339.88]|uniref:separase n=1 Tax=Galerina marginata (strain CBS 339.88) TaxID=685588 RepID=A0A067TB67_GALM3|nr:hypothetical protein GALMADRAFT_66375 [Galerina marginata CBS 339.88]
MASTSRRTLPRNQLKSVKANSITDDQLARDLATKLTIRDVKGKAKADESESPMLAMRSVNEASQALTGVVQSGWKKSTPETSKTTLSTVNSSALKASKHLAALRKKRPGDLDVERAAASVLGKLVILEVFDLAATALAEMHPRLLLLLNVTGEPANLLSIPQPVPPPSNPIVLNLISTYLVYALILKAQAENAIEELSSTLCSPIIRSLLSWLPILSALPAKHTDSLLTRAYTVLSKLCSSSSAGKPKAPPRPESIFIVRMYALRCLAHTTPGTIEANTFWDQATKISVGFVKATSLKAEEQTTSMVLNAFAELLQIAEHRSDRETFIAVGEVGRGFLAFCEHWMDLAKRAGDISTLQKIGVFMRKPSSSSSTSPQQVPLTVDANAPQQRSVLEGTKVCNVFAQALLMLENPGESGTELLISVQMCTQLLKTSTTLHVLLRPQPPATGRPREEAEVLRISTKVDRAFEKLRRSALRFIESNPVSPSSRTPSCTVDTALREWLLECVNCMQSLLGAPATRDLLTRSIDTLFILSRTILNVNNPSTFVPAFEHLKRAVTSLDTVPTDGFPLTPIDHTVDVANYTRCISGAFYNLAGSLYQALRYGNAVPFLVESCVLGSKALRLPRLEQATPNEAREKEWTQLEDQLFRRWELLAVCYSKNGDRKNAYDAFKQAIYTFPFASSGITTQSNTQSPDALFGPSASSAVKQLVTLVDRVSYLGACELLLPPEDVSLLSDVKSPSQNRDYGINIGILDPCIAGALLERQLDSLEPSQWKGGVRGIFIKLLKDTLRVYADNDDAPSTSMPIRRARTLIRCMEFVYRDQEQDSCSALGFVNVDEIGAEFETLATKLLGRDAHLSHYMLQYRISGHLWVALHAHRRADPNQHLIMSQHTEEACRLMKELLNCKPEGSPKANRKISSPKAVKKAASPKVGRIVSPKQTRTTRQRVPTAPRKAAPAKSKAALNPVTPKVRTRAVLQPVSFNVSQTPPRPSTDGSSNLKSKLAFDNFDKFLSLLQLSARILGFISLILPKARLLEVTRRLAQRHVGPTSDGYVLASLDLAHEYVTLGKLKRAASIFNPALEVVRSGQASDEVAVRFLLRFAESLAAVEDVPKSSKVYLEALELSSRLDLEQKGSTTQHRISARAKVLEIAAMASHVFGVVQYTKADIYASLEAHLQSLRLWNRAIDTLTRLSPPPRSQEESDPFETSSLKAALPGLGPSPQGASEAVKKPNQRRPIADGLEWRISEGLLSTMFALTQAYYLRGSAREAEYFARQAADLAEQLNAPGLASRALAMQGEVQLHMGQLEAAQANLTKAAALLGGISGLEKVDIHRLNAECKSQTAGEEEVHQMFDESVTMLEELDKAFRQFDHLAFGPRRSLGTSPGNKERMETLAPELLASLLSRQLWLLRDDVGDAFNSVLEKVLSLSYSTRNKAEENALMGKLTLHGVYGRFRTDMFLSSLTESTIAVPMGMGSKEQIRPIIPSHEVIDALASAEKRFWAHLSMTAANGNVVKVREAAISLALIAAFRTSLGDKRSNGPSVISTLLDCSAALTLRRDMLDVIIHKFPTHQREDLHWPLLSEDGTSVPRTTNLSLTKFALSPTSDSDDEFESDELDEVIRCYWHSVRAKYQSQVLNPSTLGTSETVGLPDTWVVINITISADKSTMFVSRQEGGQKPKEPLIFCIPLKGRRDHGGTDDGDHLTFDGAIAELQDIVRSSDECTKAAINIKADDEEARSNWWKQRGHLDVRMRELLENIEYCWLGAFKAILNPRSDANPETISELRLQFEKVFLRSLHVKDKKTKTKPSSHKKSTSQGQTTSPSHFTLDDTIMECFSTLSSKCRDEELEDLIYFILDLYQFHGVPVAIAEVDIDQVVVDIRTLLEEYAAKTFKQNKTSNSSTKALNEHIFLVLDKNVQGLPWESMPVLRGRSVSRIPGVQFLHDRLAFAKLKRESAGHPYKPQDGANVDARKGFYVLNPSGDLGRTEERFRDWANDMKTAGWDGVIGQPVSEQQFVNALKSQDLVVYFGHGGGEQYVRSHRIRSLPTCAATMLWGCSSGALRDMGDFDRTGTPYNYMLAGCPTLVANLWDVTDKDIDKISQSVFDKLGLTGKCLNRSEEGRPRVPTSIVAAVSQSRDSCKLKYLTGAAPVVYGIPFYI